MKALAERQSPQIEVMAGAQADFVFSEVRHPFMCSGRSGGKTVAGVIKSFKLCLDYPGIAGCATEPSYRACERVLIPAIRKIWGLTEGVDWWFRAGRMVIEFKNGSVLYFGYAEEPDSTRGLTLGFFWMDEPEIGFQEEAFMILQGSLRQEGYPHQGYLTGTPAGVRHWLYRRFVQHQLGDGQAIPGDQYVIYRAKTEENIYNPPELLASLQASYGDSRFARQELEGEFVTFEGQAFPDFQERTHVRNVPHDIEWKRRGIAGMDLGLVRPTAVVEIAVDMLGRVWALRELYRRNCDLGQLVRRVAEWECRFICDPTAKESIEALRRAGLMIKKARSNSFELRTQLVGARIAVGASGPGLLVTPHCPNLIEEIQSLTYQKQKGLDTQNDRWASGMDDHAFDALAYALMELDFRAYAGKTPQMQVLHVGW